MLWKSKKLTESAGQNATDEQSSYVRGRGEWLERYGTYIQQARQWRMVAFISLVITALSVGGNVVQATQSKVVPYVVEVDKLGQIVAVERASVASPTSNRVIQAELAAFVTNWRTVTADLDLQKRFLDRLSYSVTGSAKGQMREWYAANNPYERAKDKLVQVNVKSLPSPVSTNSWRVEWTETTRNHTGVQIASESYQATLAIQIQPPTTDAQILKNPGGVYVTSISTSSVMEPTTTKK